MTFEQARAAHLVNLDVAWKTFMKYLTQTPTKKEVEKFTAGINANVNAYLNLIQAQYDTVNIAKVIECSITQKPA